MTLIGCAVDAYDDAIRPDPPQHALNQRAVADGRYRGSAAHQGRGVFGDTLVFGLDLDQKVTRIPEARGFASDGSDRGHRWAQGRQALGERLAIGRRRGRENLDRILGEGASAALAVSPKAINGVIGGLVHVGR